MKHKKGLSAMIGYILLILIALSISVFIFVWMKGVIPQDVASCDSDIAINIEKLDCGSDTGQLTLKNKGLFTIHGLIIKYASDLNKLPTTQLYNGDVGNFGPGKEAKEGLAFPVLCSSAKRIQIQPYQKVEGEVILCTEAVINQNLE